MSATILEALQNAEYNLQNNGVHALGIVKSQLHNAIELLGKGYDIYDEVEPLLEKFGDVESVPDKDE